MKRLKLALGICPVVVFLISCKTIETNVVKVNMLETTYSKGYLNIVEIMNTWNIGPMVGSISGMPMIGFTNTNLQEDIQYVIVVMYMNIPIAYVYLLDGEPYVYFKNKENGSFEIIPGADKEQWKLNFQQMFLLKSS